MKIKSWSGLPIEIRLGWGVPNEPQAEIYINGIILLEEDIELIQRSIKEFKALLDDDLELIIDCTKCKSEVEIEATIRRKKQQAYEAHPEYVDKKHEIIILNPPWKWKIKP